MGLPTTATGFDQVQVHVDFLSGKVHAVPTRSTDNAADAARIILDMALRSGDGIPDVLVVDHDPKFTSSLFREFTRCIGSSLLVVSAYHKNTNAKTERVNGVLGDTLSAFANGRKDNWDVGVVALRRLRHQQRRIDARWRTDPARTSWIGASTHGCRCHCLTCGPRASHRPPTWL